LKVKLGVKWVNLNSKLNPNPKTVYSFIAISRVEPMWSGPKWMYTFRIHLLGKLSWQDCHKCWRKVHCAFHASFEVLQRKPLLLQMTNAKTPHR